MDWKIIPEGTRFRMECANVRIYRSTIDGRWIAYEIQKHDIVPLSDSVDLETAINRANKYLLSRSNHGKDLS